MIRKIKIFFMAMNPENEIWRVRYRDKSRSDSDLMNEFDAEEEAYYMDGKRYIDFSLKI